MPTVIVVVRLVRLAIRAIPAVIRLIEEMAEMNIAALLQRADEGSVVAQTAIRICYLDGVDAPVDYSEAFKYLAAAAEKRRLSDARNFVGKVF